MSGQGNVGVAKEWDLQVTTRNKGRRPSANAHLALESVQAPYSYFLCALCFHYHYFPSLFFFTLKSIECILTH